MRTLLKWTMNADGLLATSWLAIATLVFGALSLWLTGLFGLPGIDRSLDPLDTNDVESALMQADSPSYASEWDNPLQMSAVIREDIYLAREFVINGTDWYPEEFGNAGVSTAPTTTTEEDGPETVTGIDGLITGDAAEEGSELPPPAENLIGTAPNPALMDWKNEYWCGMRDWGDWKAGLVRPLVARGLGNCGFLDRWTARSPLMSAMGSWPGLAALVLLWALSAFLLFMAGWVYITRGAYRMQYRSKVF